MTSRQIIGIIGLSILLLLAITAGIFAGLASPGELFDSETGMTILLKLRIPRVLLALFVGAALAVAGASFQGVLRNPLATPYTLGVAGGASFGAYIVLLIVGRFPMLPEWIRIIVIPMGAFAGGILTASLVYGVARQRGKLSSYSLILAGVVVNFTFASLIMFLHYTAEVTDVYTIIHWMMGSLSVVGFSEVYVVLPVITICLLILLAANRSFDLLVFGEVTARSMGLDVERFIKVVFFITSVMIGVCVAFTGPIGFVGLVIPHILRLAFAGRHRFLFIASILAGGAFLTLADALAREVDQPREVPVGVFTALIGGPILAYMLMRGKGYDVGD